MRDLVGDTQLTEGTPPHLNTLLKGKIGIHSLCEKTKTGKTRKQIISDVSALADFNMCIYLCVYIYLFIYLSIYLFKNISALSSYLSIQKTSLPICVYIYMCISIYLFIYLFKKHLCPRPFLL